LQKDISESLSARARVADEAYFTGKLLKTAAGDVEVTPQLARQICRYLIKNDYSDESNHIAEAYHQARKDGTAAPLPSELQAHAEQIYRLIDSVFSDSQMPEIGNDRLPKKNPLNSNFDKQEFKELWNRINRKATYSVDFDSAELVAKAVAELDKSLRVMPLHYLIQTGEQADHVSHDELKDGTAFVLHAGKTEKSEHSIHSKVKYDLIGKIAEGTQLTRRATADILKGINADVFAQFRANPESFIAEAIRLINEQKATMIVERLTYYMAEDRFDIDIFTAAQSGQDLSKAGDKLKRHIYDYAITDSDVERDFCEGARRLH